MKNLEEEKLQRYSLLLEVRRSAAQRELV